MLRMKFWFLVQANSNLKANNTKILFYSMKYYITIICYLGAFQMPDFAIQKEMSIKCILTSLSTGNNVKMNSIESNSWDVLSRYKTELTGV